MLSYLGGGAVLGFIGWLLNGILDDFIDVGVHETGDIWNLIMYLWVAIFIIYWVFGGIYVVRRYNEHEYQGGMM